MTGPYREQDKPAPTEHGLRHRKLVPQVRALDALHASISEAKAAHPNLLQDFPELDAFCRKLAHERALKRRDMVAAKLGVLNQQLERLS